ncbi:MAG: hypothetical protein IJ268_00605 [Proteobacteria bacterium]|nr:hypothetical protein [Pseudomonadota bacterium]
MVRPILSELYAPEADALPYPSNRPKFKAAQIFARIEGILSTPESSHAIKAVHQLQSTLSAHTCGGGHLRTHDY